MSEKKSGIFLLNVNLTNPLPLKERKNRPAMYEKGQLVTAEDLGHYSISNGLKLGHLTELTEKEAKEHKTEWDKRKKELAKAQQRRNEFSALREKALKEGASKREKSLIDENTFLRSQKDELNKELAAAKKENELLTKSNQSIKDLQKENEELKKELSNSKIAK